MVAPSRGRGLKQGYARISNHSAGVAPITGARIETGGTASCANLSHLGGVAPITGARLKTVRLARVAASMLGVAPPSRGRGLKRLDRFLRRLRNLGRRPPPPPIRGRGLKLLTISISKQSTNCRPHHGGAD